MAAHSSVWVLAGFLPVVLAGKVTDLLSCYRFTKLEKVPLFPLMSL